MKLIDQAAWDHFAAINTDSYGSGVVRFAQRWAELMEARIAAGEALEDVAKATSNEADTEGITVFMYGVAVSSLAQMWVHGEELRCWHNLAMQRGTEGEAANESGGVLNPALLSVAPAIEVES